ncbi:IQ domain-containing protein [Nymphaea thermarum]|nr:IQ domain-containing protein [Nymphaea thermarum]
MGVPLSMLTESMDDGGDVQGAHRNVSRQNGETVVVRSISFNKGDGLKTVLRSVSFDGKDGSEATVLRSLGRKMIIEGSVSFKTREPNAHCLETAVNVDLHGRADSLQASILDSPKHEAAVKLQKVYKSFRTRRNLADCAVLVNQFWWSALDFATLKRSSVSFFDIDKPESAVSKWSRARTRAAKVGKGLSKDEKAQKLALQHWLEAIDPRHRYGHNLNFYYDKWLDCDSKQPFFYWLDVGEGKEVNLDKCPRLKLQQQCIKYLSPKEREAYEVIVKEGKFVLKKSGKFLDTSEGGNGAKWIFVLSTSRALYVGQKKKGTFQHSSFLAGGATSAAGRLVVLDGVLKAVWPYSGHYRPTEENFREFVSFLEDNGVDFSDVKKSPADGDDEVIRTEGSRVGALRTSSSESDIADSLDEERVVGSQAVSVEGTTADQKDSLIPNIAPSLERSESDIDTTTMGLDVSHNVNGFNSSDDETEGKCQQYSHFRKKNLFDQENQRLEVQVLPKEALLHRINSKKGMVAYQLGKQLSCKWTSGTGPRIGFVRDHPSEWQFRALEQVNLSPRSTATSRFCSSPRPT